MSVGAAVSKPTTSSMPASSGSAMVKPLETMPHDDQLRVDARPLAVAAQRLRRVDLPGPRLRVGVDDEHVDLAAVVLGVQHRQRTVGPAEREAGGHVAHVVEPLPRESGVSGVRPVVNATAS
jgi:hypothetical protein